MNKYLFLILGMLLVLSGCENNDDDDDNQGKTSSSAMSSSSMSSSSMSSSSDEASSSMSSSSSPAMTMIKVEIYNGTDMQPLSPVSLFAHSGYYNAWSIGAAASMGLEMLAEGGNASEFMSEAHNSLGDKLLGESMGTGVIMPGASETLMLSYNADATEAMLSLASMLVNTNDAFTGLKNFNLAQLSMMGKGYTLYLPIYDAGTEANTESLASVPGPAAGGEGFNAVREAHNFVSMHPGVVSMDDGLSSSALKEYHRFMNHSIRVTITKEL